MSPRAKPTGKYRSRLEKRVADALTKKWQYEPEAFRYTMERTYTPDFVHRNIWIEVKGFFRAGDRKKYLSVQAYYPRKRIIFLFSDPNKPITRYKRKDGTRMTHGEWATKNGFEFCTLDTLKDVL